MKLLKILFLLSLIALPLGEVAKFNITSDIRVSLNDIIIGLLFVFGHIYFFKNKKKYSLKSINVFTSLLFFLGIGVFLLVINSFSLSSSEFLASILYPIRFFVYAYLFTLVQEFDGGFKKNISFYLLYSGVAFVFFGYLQYFFYPNLRNLFYLGWDEHLYRMFSTFLDPNFAGAFFVLVFLLLLGKNMEVLQQKKRALFLITSSLMTLGAIYLTYSRSALIMLVVSSITFLFLIGKKQFILALSIGLAVLLFGSVALSAKVQSEGTNLLRTASGDARLESLADGWKIFSDQPFLGVGFNSYRYAQERYGFLENKYSYVNHSAAGTDNSFLFVLATTGIIGFSAYLLMWYIILKQQVHEYKKGNKIFSAVVLSSLIGLFINAFFINSLFYVFILQWMWILVGLNTKTKNYT